MNSHILLIEDEPGLVITVTDLLTGAGYEVDSAADGEAGLPRLMLPEPRVLANFRDAPVSHFGGDPSGKVAGVENRRQTHA